jgi:transposase
LHIVDATTIRAKVDLLRIRDEHRKQDPKKDISKDDINKGSPDKDAKFGYNPSTKGSVYGYKGYIKMDKDSEIIISSTVDTANEQESTHLQELLNSAKKPDVVITDKAYDTPNNQKLLKSRNIISGIIRKRVTKTNVTGCFYQGTPQSKEEVSLLSKTRQSIEHKIAELKRWHNLKNARFWGLLKTKTQMFLTCIAVNLKRIVRIIGKSVSPPVLLTTVA